MDTAFYVLGVYVAIITVVGTAALGLLWWLDV